jgi:DNA modification methylase
MIEINKNYNESNLETMAKMPNCFVDLVITSPPYYNAREYSQWLTVDDYYSEMKIIFTEVFRVIKNHKYFILNVGDIVSHLGGSKWNVKRLMLGARFICMLEDIGFEIIDDIIWDKGEPQSKRHLGNPPYPYYQKPVNCYEHIIIAEKNVIDKTRINCPDCNTNLVSSNSMTKQNVQSWECKNPNCKTKSKANRGKRFSNRSVMMNDAQVEENLISKDLIKKWHRDIIKINPVVKINSKGENSLGHTAPFPKDIAEMGVLFFTSVNELVYDCFMGSGTVAEVSILNNRNWIGSEISSEYCNIIEERIKKAWEEKRKEKDLTQKTLFGDGM